MTKCIQCKEKPAKKKFCSKKCQYKHLAETRRLQTQVNKLLKKEHYE